MTGLLAPAVRPIGSDASDARGRELASAEEDADAPRRARRIGAPRDADLTPEPRPSRARRVRRVGGAAAVLLALGAIGTAGSWGPRVLARLAFFRVRRVEIEGARYASPADLVARLGIDTTVSVWTDLDALTRRVAGHPLVDGAQVERRLPGVLRVVVHERVPVAMTASGPRGALVVYDATGAALPVTPSRVGGLDVPLVSSADPALLRTLGALRSDAPHVYARVLEAARAPRVVLGTVPLPNAVPSGRAARAVPAPGTPERDEFDFVLGPETGARPGAGTSPLFVRTAVDVTAGRFADLGPVERDLARRGVRPAELDLRFRDQVVARLP